jgi:glyoxylase-like metal-dependent hydrolase (beta-lactamase superfamily II)
MLINRIWQPVPGAHQAEIYPFIRKPDILSSNAFLIRTPEAILLIDPGAIREQAVALHEIITGLIRENPRPVLVYLTHCHIDHSLQAAEFGPLKDLADIHVVVHEAGAKALRACDRRLTLAEIYGRQYPHFQLDIRDFSASTPFAGNGAGEIYTKRVFPCHQCLLGGGDVLDAYYTPGHSPDSVCLRIGRLLFIGDLLNATVPMVAGIMGWNQSHFLQSVDDVIRLIDDRQIDSCLPSHGEEMTGSAVTAVLQGLRKEAAGLESVLETDENRVLDTAAYALELLEEAQAVFSMIAGRLYYLSSCLEELGEPEAAARYSNLMSEDRIDAYLSDFYQFTESWRKGDRLDLEFVYKVLGIVQKLQRSFDPEKLTGVIHRSLLKRAASLMTDFIEMMRGKDRQDHFHQTDLAMILKELVREWTTSLHADASILDTAHDHALFLEALAARIGYLPLFDDVEIRCRASVAPVNVTLDREHFSDALTCLLEVMAGAGARKIELRMKPGPKEVRLLVTADGRHDEVLQDARQWRPLLRKFARSGGLLRRRSTRLGVVYQIVFPQVHASLSGRHS